MLRLFTIIIFSFLGLGLGLEGYSLGLEGCVWVLVSRVLLGLGLEGYCLGFALEGYCLVTSPVISRIYSKFCSKDQCVVRYNARNLLAIINYINYHCFNYKPFSSGW